MKRKAPQDLDRDRIENGNFSDDEDKPDLGKISTPAEIGKRKILKIRGPKTQQQAQPEQAEVKFNLKNNLQEVKCEQQNQTFSFIKNDNQQQQKSNLFNNSSLNKEAENKEEKLSKPIEFSDREKEKVSQNLEDIASGKTQVKSSGLFNNNNNNQNSEDSNKKEEEKDSKKEEENKPSGGLFANLQNNKPTGGLFSNANTTTENKSGGLFSNADKSAAPASGGLFGQSSIFDKSKAPAPSGGLFANVAKQDEKKTSEGGSIFGNFNQNQQSGGLFANAGQQPQSGGLFANANKPASGGLFSGISAPPSGGLNLGQQKNDDEDDDGEDDGVVSGQEDEPVDTTKTQQYEYKKEMDKLQDKPVNKFRKNQNDVQEKGHISIERKSGDDKAQSLVIYRNKLKQVIYQGYLLKNISSVKNMNNMDQNLLIQTINQEKQQDGTMKFIKDNIKIQFATAVEGKEFKATVEDLIK